MSGNPAQKAWRLTLSGVVQGVGFRPFIYRHATRHGLLGWVRNASGRVDVHIQGEPTAAEEFIASLLASAPALAEPVIESVATAECIETAQFLILESLANDEADIHLPVDLFTCDECLEEMNDPHNRRYRYPFINCTQCGPRFTLIDSLPYDRVNTSMSTFPLCDDCAAEYRDPLDRRYHAEPIACKSCGPALSYREPGRKPVGGNEDALAAAIGKLRQGGLIAVKGIGGYHLVCDACNEEAVNRLRDSKPRPAKPLAVLFPMPPGDPLAQIRQYLSPNQVETGLLLSHARPIVLVRMKPGRKLANGIAPGLNEVGAMLPYSPLHHLLLAEFGGPLVATSANISGEPVLTDNEEVERRLSHVASAFLHHDRPIVRPADDPVVRVINQAPAIIRQGRGMAPVEIRLPKTLDRTILAVGGHMKNTIALAWQDRAVISPHIGEMDNPRSLATFEKCIDDLQALYQQGIEHIVCDAHPGYTTTRWAHRQSLEVSEVFHHHAHASAAYAADPDSGNDPEPVIAFTWDGVGMGEDGTLWGGEAFLGVPGSWRRVATFRPFRLPGGEKAGREPWRSAAALCWESGQLCPLDEAADPLLYKFWQQGKNAPQSTAAGRIFDAAAALTGVCTRASFEGQGPMYLETRAAGCANIDQFGFTGFELELADGVYRADWSPLLPILQDHSLSLEHRAAHFHASMANCLLMQALAIRSESNVNRVAIGGGVFQNRVLTEHVARLLHDNGFQLSTPGLTPVNDAGISFGQIIEYAYRTG